MRLLHEHLYVDLTDSTQYNYNNHYDAITIQVLLPKTLSDAISEHLNFENFPGEGMPPDPPSFSMLCMLG